jgi:hypothetical protein
MTKETPPTGASRTRIDWILILLAAGLFLVLALRAAVSIDPSADAWFFRLPWAAQLAGMMPADSYVWNDHLAQRFAGFPLLIEWGQGQLWRLTGRPEMANLVALGSLILFVVFLRVRFKVPMTLALLGLVAIPLVQVQATGTSADLPANLALTAAFLMLMPLYSTRTPPRLNDAALFFLACALAAHAKLAMLPLVTLVFVLGFLGITLGRLRRPAEGKRRVARLLGTWIFAILAAGLVFLIPIKNLVLHGDPVYPMGLKAGALSYAGPQDSYELRADGLARIPAGSGSQTLGAEPSQAPSAGTPSPGGEDPIEPFRVRAAAWANEVFDVGAEPLFGHAPWAQAGAQKLPLAVRDSGFLGWYAIFNLALFVTLIIAGMFYRLGVLVLFAIATALAILAPDHTALHDYLFWMTLLVSLNLIMLRPGGDLKPSSASTRSQRLFGLVALVALALGIYATQGATLRPTFESLDDLLAAKRDPATLAQVQSHPASCLVGEDPSRVFLYAPIFSEGKTYRLKMGPVAGEPHVDADAACGTDWTPVVVAR